MTRSFFEKTSGNTVTFLMEGDEYYKKYLDLIRESKESIHLQTYIFDEDIFGREVIAELKLASRRGIKVYLLVDRLGSLDLKINTEKELRESGVKFSKFNFVQFKLFGQWGRRLHHKVLLIDHNKALIGGINVVSQSYKNKEVPHQLDFAVYLQGPATKGLTEYCQLIFSKSSSKKIKFEKKSNFQNSDANGVDLKISINDWIYQRWQITKQYSELTQSANNEILILNSYFFPRKKFMKQLVQAAQRGVRVRLILPELSDWPSYVLATQYLYSYFLRNGVEIYQWKKSIMHGKLATIDGRWSTIGSFNLNYTGYQQNLEMNVDIYSEKFTQELNDKIYHLIDSGCEKIEPIDFIEKASLKTRVLRFCCYVVLHAVANLSIGLAFQEENKRSRVYNALYVGAALTLLIVGVIGLVIPIIPGIALLSLGVLLLMLQNYFNDKNV